ncbi:MAG: pilus assembly PilX N-terminal domain-containing protein [Acidobacteriota bacterium]|nr:pilus assembly PilX N-terminal domain-containing protein [Acidobacteriota bacterium]
MSQQQQNKRARNKKSWKDLAPADRQIYSQVYHRPSGSGMIVVILVLAFMLTVGLAVLTVTSSGPKVSASMRYQEEAFNAAEAGFDAARIFISNEGWTDFGDHYLKGLTEHGIDVPLIGGDLNTPNPGYFRRLTDEQILTLIDANHDGVPDSVPQDQLIFFEEPFVYNQSGNLNQRYRYTVFIIDDEAGFEAASNPADTLMVCIGVVRSGPNVTDRILGTCRLEIEIEMP